VVCELLNLEVLNLNQQSTQQFASIDSAIGESQASRSGPQSFQVDSYVCRPIASTEGVVCWW
jgi:hypothetical protein